VTSLDQKAEMKLARTIRLELKNIRVAAEKERVKLKANALLMGKAIDGVNNLLLAAIVPLEKHLEEQEQYGERLAEAERLRIKAEREALLAPFLGEGQPVASLEIMSAEQWDGYFSDAKLLHAAKIEAARKAEAERIAKEQAEAAERERLRIENERLRAEALEREAKAKAEREAAEKAQREAAEVARKEREAIEAKAKAELEAAEKEINRIKAESDKAAKLEAERQAYEASKQKAAADAAKKAARAPDKQKALAFAATVRALKAPEASTSEGKAVMAEITAKIEGFAKWIEAQASAI
ncbi:hypothetical protein UFOVP673_47, partial [uncultured Caudovirales phage]